MKPLLLKAKDVQKTDKERDLSCVIPQKYNGILVNYIEFEKESRGIPHYHPDGYELVMLIKGKAWFKDQVLDKKGDMICFPSGCEHDGIFKRGTKIVVVRNSSNKVLI